MLGRDKSNNPRQVRCLQDVSKYLWWDDCSYYVGSMMCDKFTNCQFLVLIFFILINISLIPIQGHDYTGIMVGNCHCQFHRGE